ncbi:MAG TPA: MmgE/PrpD family protein [Stellaceae bacterium]|nr:MmgE/PrpD family protein [Stellaceae bacterium]
MTADPAVDRIVAFVETTLREGVPAAVREAAKIFAADTLGVAVAGVVAPWRRAVLDAAREGGGGAEATVLGSGERLPAAAAAMVNAYQIHAQEFDCVHDRAVVHAMSAVLPALLAAAEGSRGVAGELFLRALVAGVEVAVNLGLCSRAPMRFFRPANAGGFGATVGLAMLSGLDGDGLRDALGIYYGACSGTMQAHLEASPQLAMQMGFAAKNALAAVALARRGMPGPRAPFSGDFGYFALFDGQADPAPFATLGHAWRTAELSHKPFPTGRATHAGIDGVRRLLDARPDGAKEVSAVRFFVPPLTARLVGRPARPGMTPGYARLCLAYIGAVLLRQGEVGLADFTPAALSDSAKLDLARHIAVVEDGNPDPNALGPQRVEIDLAGGGRLETAVGTVIGSPANPLSPAEAKKKFTRCWHAAPGLAPERGETLWQAAHALEGLADIGELARLAAP